jgi:cytochrome c oxidase subunit I
MTATTAPDPTSTSEPRRGRPIVPSLVSGLVLGVIGAVVFAIIAHHLLSGSRQADATIAAAYVGWFFCFLIGMGAANYPIQWLRGRPGTSHEQELELMGKDQGVWRYFRFCTDHKVVGIQYLVLVLILFAVGGLASWMIRLEQSRSGAKVFTPATYNTIVGMHGVVMIATTIIMISATFGNYFVPILIGADDMAFPRLNALSFWTLFTAVPVLLSVVVLGGFPTGWTGYSPLADQAALGMDAYCFTIMAFAFSLLLGAINIFVTVLRMRAPGMTWDRIPMFVWAVLASTLLGLIVFPAFFAAVLLTLLDRVFGTSFYQAAYGGSNFLYEQLFWFMGHPEVYVIALPAIGVIAEVIPVFTRKPLFGHRLVLGGIFGIFTLSLVVWMHHLYWSGANTPVDLPTMLDTELISIPTGLVFLAIIGTLWRARMRIEAPMLFALGFVFNFLIGGVTGLYLADVPTDTIFHGNIFTVAHFHFTLVGGGVFGFLTGFYYWFPKMTGRRLHEGLAKLHFWLFEIGFLGVFLPLFYAGLKGEPRWQAYVDPKFGTANLISSLFAIFIIASVAVFGYNVLISWIWGERAVPNPWGGRTLEWLVPSPVPLVNFEAPVVVTAGPYDYGMGGARVMGVPAIAGAATDVALPAHPPHADPEVRADMTRWGARLAIVSWTMLALCLFVGYIYLDALNTQGQFHPAGEPKPSALGNILVTVGALAAAALWSYGYRLSRSDRSRLAGGWMGLAWLLTAAGLVGDLVIFATLKAPTPLHAYASFMSLFIFFHAWHLIVALVITTLVLGTAFRQKLAGREHVAQVVGWWLWYAAIVSVVLVVITATIS